MEIYKYRRDEYFKQIETKLVKKDTDDLDLPFVFDEYFFLKIAYYLKIGVTSFFIRHLMEEIKSKNYPEEELGYAMLNQFKLKFRIFPGLMASKDFDNRVITQFKKFKFSKFCDLTQVLGSGLRI